MPDQITGWKYQRVGDATPSEQYCHVLKASVPDGLQLGIARNRSLELFNQERAARAGVTWGEVHQALPHCDWFKGTNPNIREKVAGLP